MSSPCTGRFGLSDASRSLLIHVLTFLFADADGVRAEIDLRGQIELVSLENVTSEILTEAQANHIANRVLLLPVSLRLSPRPFVAFATAACRAGPRLVVRTYLSDPHFHFPRYVLELFLLWHNVLISFVQSRIHSCCAQIFPYGPFDDSLGYVEFAYGFQLKCPVPAVTMSTGNARALERGTLGNAGVRVNITGDDGISPYRGYLQSGWFWFFQIFMAVSSSAVACIAFIKLWHLRRSLPCGFRIQHLR